MSRLEVHSQIRAGIVKGESTYRSSPASRSVTLARVGHLLGASSILDQMAHTGVGEAVGSTDVVLLIFILLLCISLLPSVENTSFSWVHFPTFWDFVERGREREREGEGGRGREREGGGERGGCKSGQTLCVDVANSY